MKNCSRAGQACSTEKQAMPQTLSTLQTIAAVFLVTASAVALPRLTWIVVEAYVLASPEGGRAFGGLGFVVSYVALAAAISGLVASGLAGMAAAAGALAASRVYMRSALVGGLILSGGTFLIPSLASHGLGPDLLGDIGAVAVNWAAISAAALALSYAGVLRWLPGSRSG